MRLQPPVDGTIEQYGTYTLLRVESDRLMHDIVRMQPNTQWAGRAVAIKPDEAWALVTALRKLGFTITGIDLH